jgi:hypothetical protein
MTASSSTNRLCNIRAGLKFGVSQNKCCTVGA